MVVESEVAGGGLVLADETRSSSDAIEARVRALRDSRSHPGPARLCMLRLRNKSEKGFTLVTLPQMPRLGRLRSSSRLRGRGRGRERGIRVGGITYCIPPPCEGRSPGHGPGGSTCHAGTRTYTYHTIRALLFAAGHTLQSDESHRESFPPRGSVTLTTVPSSLKGGEGGYLRGRGVGC